MTGWRTYSEGSRAISDQERPGDDATRRIDGPGTDAGGEPTQRISAWEGEAPLREDANPTAGDDRTAAPTEDDDVPPAGPGRGKMVAIALVAALVGFVIAFVVVALGTGDDGASELAAMQEEVDDLEAALEERDARIADLEARLDEAEAAAGQRADDIETQREALDARAAALDEREAALEERQNALAERERAVEDAAEDEDGTAPTFDEETTQGIVDRVVEQIRDLFQ